MQATRRWIVWLASLASILALAPAASAATTVPNPTTGNPFGCRASGIRTDLGGSDVVEPVVANPATYPCYDQSSGVASTQVPTGNSQLITAGPVGAFTYVAGSSNGSTAYGAAAVASVKAVNIPTSQGIITIVGPAEADAAYECVSGKVVGYGQSTLDVVYVNGKATFIPAGGQQQTIPLGGGAYIVANEKITTPTSITERVLDVHLSNGTDVIVGEAMVTLRGSDPCATSTGQPPVLEICPQGSTLDVVHQECVIRLPGQVIYVSRPFQGPSGGVVMALSVARKRFHSPCLYGTGPKFALIATKRGARVLGTPRSDRILAFGALERVSGLGGNDCIDGKGFHQQLFDGNGKDRVWGGSGFTRIAVGNGNDYVNGRGGRDWITAGNGNDKVIGGKQTSRIDIGLGRDVVYGGPAKNRIWAGGDNARVNCGSGRNNTAFVRKRARHYAATHGCQHVHVLK